MQTSLLASPLPPFRYLGGDLGLSDNDQPWIEIADATGQKWLTHSVEFVLRHIDDFEDSRAGGRAQLLAAASNHYGMDTHALARGRGL